MLNCQLFINPPQSCSQYLLCCFFHLCRSRRSSAGLFYTNTSISITWNVRLLAVNPFDPSTFLSFCLSLRPPSHAEPVVVFALLFFSQTDSRRETHLNVISVQGLHTSVHTLLLLTSPHGSIALTCFSTKAAAVKSSIDKLWLTSLGWQQFGCHFS